MTFISNSSTNAPTFDYTSRDYASIYADLLNRIPNYLPEWTSRSQTDFGLVLLQMFAYVGDILGYYEDRIAGEAFLQTATQPQSILNIAAMLDYQPTQTVGAVATLQITISNAVVGPYTIPMGTQFQTLASAITPPVIFETNTALTIAGANSATPSVTGTVVATQGVTQTNEQVGTSSGNINQSFQLKYNPVIEGSLTVYVDLGTGPVAWTFAQHLIDWGPSDHVYTTFVAPNNVTYIIFGDNVNGLVPPLGSPITATYRVGVGAKGNVGANTIVQPVTALIGVVGITNPNAASGGSDPETLSSIAAHAPVALKSLNRAVTVDDLEALALQVPGVEWASAVEATYQLVNLYISPFGGGNPSSTLIANVLNYLNPLVMANTTVTIQNPVYVPINITVAVVAYPQFGNSATQVLVKNAIGALLAQTNTGFGYRVSLGLVYETILATTGVNYAIVSALNRSVLVTTTAVLSNGSNYTVLSVTPLPQQVNSGDTIIITNGVNTQTLTASGNSLAGAASLTVGSFTANATYPIGTDVQDTTGANDAILLSNEIPTAGTITITVTGGLAGS